MVSFDKKIAELRKGQKMSQTELAKQLSTSFSIIKRYERDEMPPSIDVARKLAVILNTIIGSLLGEPTRKTPDMLR
jgi:transcriptional regulator with XRE-family HTH domain